MALTLLQMKALFPDPVRQGIVDMMYREGPALFDRLNFIKHNAMAYPYTQEVALPGVSFRGLGEEFAAAAKGVVNPTVETLAILGGEISTDSIYIAQKGLGPARSWRLAKKAKAAARFFIKNFFVGSKATTPKGFDGLKIRLGSSLVITNSTNGALPIWESFVKAQDLLEGENSGKLLCMNITTRRNLSFEVSAHAMNMGMYDVGQQLTTFNGSPIFIIGNDEAGAAILSFTETCGSGVGTCASAYCVRLGSDVDEEYVQGISGLDPIIQFLDVGYTGTQYKDVMQMGAGMGLFSGFCASRIEGILAA